MFYVAVRHFKGVTVLRVLAFFSCRIISGLDYASKFPNVKSAADRCGFNALKTSAPSRGDKYFSEGKFVPIIMSPTATIERLFGNVSWALSVCGPRKMRVNRRVFVCLKKRGYPL
jgi:hypothetical protein